MDDQPPKRPEYLSRFAELCLQAISESGYTDRISLGGTVGLMHYHEYRQTHDVDACWLPTTSQQERKEVVEVLEATLRPFGNVQTRRWGDVTSIELQDSKRTVFSFQIAERSIQLEPLELSPWTGILLDSLEDLVASKMVALVERGAPRDFRDIYELCQTELTNIEECWQLWSKRQTLAGSDADLERARLAIQLHLERIEKHRPIASINNPDDRLNAERVRLWFRKEFIPH